MFTGQTSDLQFPRGEPGAVVAWEGEVDATAETTPTYGNIQLSPNRLAAYTDYSIQAGTQSTFDLEADLRQRLASAASIEWDRVALIGSGVAAEPLGIINQVGVGVIPTATNKVDWPTALAYPAGLGEANVQIEGPVSYMSTAGVRAHLMSSAKDSGSGLFVMNDAGMVAGFPFWMNNNLPNDGGTASDEHTMVFGKWSDNYMAQWNGTSILYDPYTQAVSGTIRLVLNLYLDNNIAHPESFNYSADIIP
jgi:HK97 family phage major capsid protein